MPNRKKSVKVFRKSDTSLPSHIFAGCWKILIFWIFSNQNVPQRGIAANCWQYSFEILKWFVSHHINIIVLISNFFQLEIKLYYMPKVEADKNENNSHSLSSVFLYIVACQILYSLIFKHYLRILSWCKWK